MSAMLINGRTYFYKVLGKTTINFLLNIVMSAMLIKGRTYFYKVLSKMKIKLLAEHRDECDADNKGRTYFYKVLDKMPSPSCRKP